MTCWIRPLYPDDLTDSRRHMVLFLSQYSGRAHHYDQERGHPRPPDAPRPVRDRRARSATPGCTHMLAALDATATAQRHPTELVGPIRDHLVNAADFLVNAR